MSQQINLLTPILLAPKRYFSALAMLQALGLLLLGGLVISLWLLQQSQQARAAFAVNQQQMAAEQQQLLEALTRLPAPADAKAIEQQWQSLSLGNERQSQVLRALRGGLGRDGERHSDLLKLLAASVPPAVWISELRWLSSQGQTRLELVGATLDTVALRIWLARLSKEPLLQGQQLSAVRVEKWAGNAYNAYNANNANNANNASSSAALVGTPVNLPSAGPAVWAFRVVSELAPPSKASSAGAPS